jgi:hypothetical protein
MHERRVRKTIINRSKPVLESLLSMNRIEVPLSEYGTNITRWL